MKIKLDFVTNSSSTSFVVIGSQIELNDIPHDYINNIAEKHNFPVDEALDEPYELIEYFTAGSNLEHSFGSEYDDNSSVMVGISYSQMKDDETLKEFKKRVQLQILEKFGLPTQPGHIEECWRDG
jgi:hypothetical protein